MSTQTVEMTNVDYEEQREARGTKQNLARLVKPANIVDLANGDKSARFRLAINNEFYTASAYIKAGKDALEQFYAGLEKGQLTSRNGRKVSETSAWIIANQKTFATAWVLGSWRLEETGEIVKVEVTDDEV